MNLISKNIKSGGESLKKIIPNNLREIFTVALLSIASLSFGQGQTRFNFYNTTGQVADFIQTFQIPACVTTITVECWGGSGGGRGATGNAGGGGGGGGAYSKSVLTGLTPLTTYTVSIGTPGAAGSAGGDTWFGSAATVMAKGGLGSTNGNGGAGGTTAGVGQTKYAGGNGGNYSGDGGGGGGGTAGPTGPGGNGSNGNGNVGGAGGTSTLGYGIGGAGGSDNAVGTDNTQCIGCGGGGGSGTNGATGGGGSQGYVRVTIPAPLYATVSSAQSICPGNSPANLTTTATGANGGPYSYVWQSSTNSASGFTNITGTANNNTPAPINTTTWYRAIVSSGTCTPDTTDAVEIFVSNLSGSVSFPQTICTGNTPSPLTAIVIPSNAPASYQWQESTISATSGFSNVGANSTTYSPSGSLNSSKWYRTVINAPGCVSYTTSAVDAVPSNASAVAYPGKSNTTIYSTNTYTLINSSVSGSATTGAWSITSSSPAGAHLLSTTAQTNKPNEVTFTPASTSYTGTVVLTLTTNSNGCNVAVATKTITVLPSYTLDTVWNTAGNYIWTVPGCVSTVTIQVWGAGGGGGGANLSLSDGGGGAGGGFSSSVLPVTQGTTYSLTVGAGGTSSFSSRGAKGGDSWFSTPFTVRAQGGSGGIRNGGAGEDGSGGTGGQASAGYGQIKWSGGNGAQGGLWPGGSGGSSAGPTANGCTPIDPPDGARNRSSETCTGPVGSGAGGAGSNSAGGANVYIAYPGTGPGGGGGGGTSATNKDPGDGADGQVKVSWGPSIPVFIDLTVSPSATICLGESAVIRAESEFPVSYSWSTGHNSAPNVLKDSITVTPGATGTYSYTLTDLNGCASDVVQTIKVNAVPSVSVTNTTICAGQAGTITASGGTGYVWNTGASTASLTRSPATTTTYTVTATTANCTVKRTGTMSVNPLPVVSVTPKTTCSGTSTTLNATGATTYTWSTGITTSALTIVNPTATTVYTVTGTTNGCNGATTGTITVNPLPTATIGGTTTVCRSAPNPNITFTGANGTAPYTFTYTLNGGANQTLTTTVGNSATVSVPTNSPGTYTYSLISVQDASSTACSQNQTGSAIVTVNPAPGAAIAGDIALCLGAAAPNVTFTGNSGTPPYKFTYNINGGASQTVTTTGGNSTVIVVAPTGSSGIFVYSLTGVQDAAASACGFATGTATVTVNSLPTATIGGTASRCVNGPQPDITFTGATTTAPYIFTYNINGGANQTVSSDGTGIGIVSAPTSGPGTFTYNLVSIQDATAQTCAQAQTGNAVVTVNPLSGSLAGTINVCKNDPTPTITFTGTGGTAPYTFTYNINGNADQTITSGGSGIVTVNAPTGSVGIFNYGLTAVTDAVLTCASVSSTTVTVNDLPTATISGNKTICINSPSPVITFTGSNTTAPYTFTYSINGGANQTVTSDGTGTATITAPTNATGNSTYSLISVQDASSLSCKQNQSGSIVISIVPMSATISTATPNICETGNGTVTFTESVGSAPFNFIYTINGGPNQTITSASGSNNVTLTMSNVPGTYVYNLISDSDAGGCSQAQAGAATIKIDSIPVAVSGGNSIICETGTASISGASSANGSILWTENGAGNIISGINTLSPVYSASAGDAGHTVTLTMTVTSTNSCNPQTATATYTVKVDSIPVGVSGGSHAICQNGFYTLASGEATAANGSISWAENGAGSITSGGSTLSPTYTATAGDAGNLVTLTMTVTSTNACNPQKATATYNIQVDSIPIAVSGGNTAICQGTSYTLLSGEATAVNGLPQWTENGNGIITSGATGLTPTYSSTAADAGHTVTLTLTVSSNNACVGQSATAFYTIKVDSLPIAVAGGNKTICENDSARVSGASSKNGSIVWANGGTGTLTNSNTLTPTYTATAGDVGNPVVLTMTVTSTNACAPNTASTIFTIKVDPLPVATSSASQTICANQSATIGGASSLYGTISWSPNIGAAGSITAGGTTNSPTYTSALGDGGHTVTLTMTVQSNNACIGKSATAFYPIMVNPLPQATIGSDITVCQNEAPAPPVTFTGSTGTAPYTFTYKLNSGAPKTISSTAGNNSAQVSAPTAIDGVFTYSLMSVQDGNQCLQNQLGGIVLAKVTVNKLPTASINTTTVVCQNTPQPAINFTGFYAGSSNQYTFNYTINSASGASSNSVTSTNGSKGTTYAPTSTPGTYVYRLSSVSYNSGKVCSNPQGDSAVVKVKPLPMATMKQDKIDVCKDSLNPHALFEGSNGTAPYTFTFKVNNTGSNNIQSFPGTYSVSSAIPTGRTGTYDYSLVSVTDSNNCTQNISNNNVTFNIRENSYASFQISPEVTTLLEPEITITDVSISTEMWLWNFGDGSISPSNNPQSHSYADTGTYTIKLITNNKFNCKDSTTQTVKIELPFMLYIPNTFSPNDDGVNDVFLPQGDGILKFSMMIYDRWGNMIFFTDDITKGWDGKANSGKDIAQIDSYIYVMTATDLKKHDHSFRGTVNMVK